MSNSMVGRSATPEMGACSTTLFSNSTQIGFSLSSVNSSPSRRRNQVVLDRLPQPSGKTKILRMATGQPSR